MRIAWAWRLRFLALLRFLSRRRRGILSCAGWTRSRRRSFRSGRTPSRKSARVADAEQRKKLVRAKIMEALGGLPDYTGPLNPESPAVSRRMAIDREGHLPEPARLLRDR